MTWAFYLFWVLGISLVATQGSNAKPHAASNQSGPQISFGPNAEDV
jgi:hypothetical protein